MLKQMSAKKLIIIVCAAVLAFAAAVLLVLGVILGEQEAFRPIMIYELEGNALIERVDGQTIDARENLYLESGDRILVSEASLMCLKLDHDKYITAEARAIFTLEAEGNERNSKTRIKLERGAVTNEIQNPLSRRSTYETSTLNSVIEVRGTIYRAELYENEDGKQDMRLCCFEGTVATMPVLPDGSMGEEVLVQAGNEMTVYTDGTVSELQHIDFESLPPQAVETLNALNIDMNPVYDEVPEAADGMRLFNEGIAAKEDLRQREGEPETADVGSGIDNTVQNENDRPVDSFAEIFAEFLEDTGGNEESTEIEGNGFEEGNTSAPQEDNAPGQGSDERKPGRDSGQDPDEKKPGENSGQDPDEKKPGGDSGQDPNEGNSGEDPDDRPHPPSGKEKYKVTFLYNDLKFAFQYVKGGEYVKEPALVPELSGRWDFDFNEPITDDTIIYWIAGSEGEE